MIDTRDDNNGYEERPQEGRGDDDEETGDNGEVDGDGVEVFWDWGCF